MRQQLWLALRDLGEFPFKGLGDTDVKLPLTWLRRSCN
jgi:hypothetical protein